MFLKIVIGIQLYLACGIISAGFSKAKFEKESQKEGKEPNWTGIDNLVEILLWPLTLTCNLITYLINKTSEIFKNNIQ